MARLKFFGRNKEAYAIVGTCSDRGETSTEAGTDVVWLVIAVEGGEGDAEFRTTFLPFTLLAEQTVGDVAETAVALAQSGTNPVGDFSPHGGVRVVHTDEFTNGHGRRLRAASHGVTTGPL